MNSQQMPPGLAALAFPIEELQPDPRNARVHNQRNMAAVMHSLQTFGWRGVVIAHQDTKQLLAGHARVAAAKQLGWTHAPVLFVDDDKARAMAFALADNRTAELAEWDWDQLTASLRELERDDAINIGFTQDELNSLLSLDPGTDAMSNEELRNHDALGTQAAAQKDRVRIVVEVHKSTASALQQRLQEIVAEYDASILP